MNSETLATKCRKVIATNIDRYPVESIGCLPELEWEVIVELKYQMTAPKVQVQKVKGSNLLSDGRKFPVFTEKFMKEVEEKNPHLRSSAVTDELVWRDCVDFKFKVGGTSRPAIFREPWNMQVQKLKSTARKMESLSLHDVSNTMEESTSFSSSSSSSSSPLSPAVPCERKVRSIVKELQSTPMSVPLLSESGVGKALKKFIKKLHKIQQATDNDDRRSLETSKTLLENLLRDWKNMASANGVDMSRNSKAGLSDSVRPRQSLSSVSGQSRHTSNEQHMKDISLIQKCAQWRDLFDVLAEREQTLIRHHGAKMRKIRDNLEVDRPKIITATTKKRGAVKVLKEQGGIQVIGNNTPSKLGKLRQQFNDRNAKIKGGKACINSRSSISSSTPPFSPQRSSFGSSVSSAMSRGKKRKSTLVSNSYAVTSSTSKMRRHVALKDGKTMKLPKMSSSLRGRKF